MKRALTFRPPQADSHRDRPAVRLVAVILWATSAIAQAQQIGQGLINYATPIILFLGVGAIVVALVAAVFKPEIVKSAIWAGVILVVIFFILRNAAHLQTAVQQ